MANTHSLDLEKDSSQYATAVDSASLSITGNITIETWWYMESSFSAGETRYLVHKGGSYSVRIVESSGTLLMFFNVNNGTTNEDLQVDFGGLAIATWHHVAISWVAATGVASFYRGGVLIAAPTSTITALANTANVLSIGSVYTGGSYWDGLIDETRIWNINRSEAEIQANMHVEVATDSSGLQAYYRYNNDLNDSTANANTLTGSGSPTFSTSIPFQTLTRSLVENMGLTDTLSRSLTKVMTLIDSVGITDARSYLIILLSSLSDSMGVSDTLNLINSYTRGNVDSIGLTDFIVRVISANSQYDKPVTLENSNDLHNSLDGVENIKIGLDKITDNIGKLELIDDK